MFDTQGMLRSAASSLEGLSPDLLEQLRAAGSKELLPVPQALAELFPEGGVRRGSTITVSGSSSLVLAVLAEVSQHQGWCAEVGSPLLGSAAAAEAGVDLERFVRVAEPGEQWPSVVASLLEAFDIVVIHPAASRSRSRYAPAKCQGPRTLGGVADNRQVGGCCARAHRHRAALARARVRSRVSAGPRT